ncbi:MAG TPA: carbohydrate ABC transporter permease [Candidatus Limivivens merdigallinarum]|uniref:Carbohydrate ABC transporter permease n=1 Tax=Candidatus Limivivens merdigallinarum TaxID=2840859 RepID=A0A9D1D1M3_9FIRM|nr:carbohydrate ABC transporter permease [Candidatus Limivivens merdigallinarum]
MKKKWTKILLAAAVIFFLFIQLYPVVWLFLASIKPSTELATQPFALPKEPTFQHYVDIFREGAIFRYMWNSLKVTSVSIILIVALSSTAGFALSKFKFRITKPIYTFFTFGIMIPVQITLIPLFCFYSDMGILNSSFTMILPQVGFALPLSVMMFVSFYSFVPNELIEAAVMDGCSTYGIFGRIVFPLAKNTVITVASMYCILIWNDFIFANTFITDNAAKTVALGLRDYVGAFGNVNWGMTYAAIAVTILPPMIVYFALNKYVTAGMTMGATKG